MEADVWGVYDADGARRGTIRVTDGSTGPFPWSPRMLLMHATMDTAWGVTYDDFGVPTLHSLRATATRLPLA